MTKLTRSTIQWNSGVMLGWNSSGTMKGIMHPNPRNRNSTLSNEHDPELYHHGYRGTTDRNISSFFPETSNGNNRRKSKPQPRTTSTRREYYEPQKDFSVEFLEYLRSLSKRDFEHAIPDNTDPNQQIPGTLVDRNNNPIYPLRPGAALRRPVLDQNNNNGRSPLLPAGHDLFSPTIAETHTSARPVTVPRYIARQPNANINRGVLRPSEGMSSFPVTNLVDGQEAYNSRIRALTRTKVTPSQVDNFYEGNNQQESSAVSATGSTSDRPVSAASSQGGPKRVTFAADVVNYERENKPSKKKKMPKRRRQGFPHPSRGIFVPPETEIVDSTGPTGICRSNPYLNFNQVWTHPSARTTGESSSSRVIRQQRFHSVMVDLEHAHIHYNRLVSIEQNDYLLQSIFKRYILVLDLALTEGHLTQVEHLLETISKSVPVLQQNTFYYLYGSQMEKDLDENKHPKTPDEENPDLVMTRYALSRISLNLPRVDCADMCIETVLVKLLLELIELVFSPYGSYEFRNALCTVPFTVRQAVSLLKELRNSKDIFCYIKWINNSAVQRDFRSIMKNLGMMDKHGCKADIGQAASSSSSSSSSKLNVFPPTKPRNIRITGPIRRRLVRTSSPRPETVSQSTSPARPNSS